MESLMGGGTWMGKRSWKDILGSPGWTGKRVPEKKSGDDDVVKRKSWGFVPSEMLKRKSWSFSPDFHGVL